MVLVEGSRLSPERSVCWARGFHWGLSALPGYAWSSTRCLTLSSGWLAPVLHAAGDIHQSTITGLRACATALSFQPTLYYHV